MFQNLLSRSILTDLDKRLSHTHKVDNTPLINYLSAKIKGLMTEADLQRNDGSCETIGVIILLSPKAAVITTKA